MRTQHGHRLFGRRLVFSRAVMGISDDMDEDSQATLERRQQGDRRHQRRYRYRDRRTGFQRRTAGLRLGALSRGLYALRDSPRVLGWMLIVTNALNVLDFLLTVVVLESGAREANPILRPLLALNPLYAGLFKVVLVLAATLLVWRARQYALALISASVMLAVFTCLIIYHIVLLAVVGW